MGWEQWKYLKLLLVDFKGNREVLNEVIMIKDMVSEEDLHRKTWSRSDWAKLMNSTGKHTER